LNKAQNQQKLIPHAEKRFTVHFTCILNHCKMTRLVDKRWYSFINLLKINLNKLVISMNNSKIDDNKIVIPFEMIYRPK